MDEVRILNKVVRFTVVDDELQDNVKDTRSCQGGRHILSPSFAHLQKTKNSEGKDLNNSTSLLALSSKPKYCNFDIWVIGFWFSNDINLGFCPVFTAMVTLSQNHLQ
jgi:hypothetical protein